MLISRLRSQWFLIALGLCVLLARAGPSLGAHGGPIKPEWTVKVFCVGGIFLLSGLTIRRRDLKEAIFQWKVHVLIQGFTLAIVPFMTHWFIAPIVLVVFNKDNLVRGLTSLSCMPPPVSSAVILTKAAGGNEPAAIFNSTLGSLLGVFVTPTLLLIISGESSSLPLSSIFLQLGSTVVGPLLLGQSLQGCFHSLGWLGQHQQRAMSLISQWALLLIIYTTFCDAFSHGQQDMDMADVFEVIFIVFLYQLVAMSMLFRLTARSLKQHYTSKDAVCIIFCGVHKSLTLGIPMLRVLYESSPHLSSLCLPLLVYHPMQIMLGGLLVPYFKNYIRRKSSTYNMGIRI